MNKKERRLAIATALHSAAASITVVEDFAVSILPLQSSCVLDWSLPGTNLRCKLQAERAAGELQVSQVLDGSRDALLIRLWH